MIRKFQCCHNSDSNNNVVVLGKELQIQRALDNAGADLWFQVETS